MGETLPYRDFVYDEVELKRFFDTVLYPLEPYEVFYSELIASDRFLRGEEKEKSGFSGTRVVERRAVREYDWDMFRSSIRRYEAHKEAYLVGGVPIPQRAFTVSVNINPSSLLEAYRAFNAQVVEILTRVLGGDDRYRDDLRGVEERLMIALANSHARKRYTDIRVDVDQEELAGMILRFLAAKLEDYGVEYYVLRCATGYHVLVRRESISRNNDSVKKTNEFALEAAGGARWEVAINTTELVPLPGTVQAGSPVRIEWEYRS